MTERGYRIYQDVGLRWKHHFYKSFDLKPGETAPTHNMFKILNYNYDLSESGEYELTFYTRNFLGDDEHQIGEYPKPCTIRFTIEDDFYDDDIEWPDDEKTAGKPE